MYINFKCISFILYFTRNIYTDIPKHICRQHITVLRSLILRPCKPPCNAHKQVTDPQSKEESRQELSLENRE